MSRQSVQFCLDVNLLKKIEHTPHRYTILYSSTIYKYFLMFIKYKNFNLSIMNFQLSNLSFWPFSIGFQTKMGSSYKDTMIQHFSRNSKYLTELIFTTTNIYCSTFVFCIFTHIFSLMHATFKLIFKIILYFLNYLKTGYNRFFLTCSAFLTSVVCVNKTSKTRKQKSDARNMPLL